MLHDIIKYHACNWLVKEDTERCTHRNHTVSYVITVEAQKPQRSQTHCPTQSLNSSRPLNSIRPNVLCVVTPRLTESWPRDSTVMIRTGVRSVLYNKSAAPIIQGFLVLMRHYLVEKVWRKFVIVFNYTQNIIKDTSSKTSSTTSM